MLCASRSSAQTPGLPDLTAAPLRPPAEAGLCPQRPQVPPGHDQLPRLVSAGPTRAHVPTDPAIRSLLSHLVPEAT